MKRLNSYLQCGAVAVALAAVPAFAQTGASPTGSPQPTGSQGTYQQGTRQPGGAVSPSTANPARNPSTMPGDQGNSTPTGSREETPSPTAGYATDYSRTDSGSHNFGWIGLLGLVGLTGLFRRGDRVDRTDTPNLPRT